MYKIGLLFSKIECMWSGVFQNYTRKIHSKTLVSYMTTYRQVIDPFFIFQVTEKQQSVIKFSGYFVHIDLGDKCFPFSLCNNTKIPCSYNYQGFRHCYYANLFKTFNLSLYMFATNKVWKEFNSSWESCNRPLATSSTASTPVTSQFRTRTGSSLGPKSRDVVLVCQVALH